MDFVVTQNKDIDLCSLTTGVDSLLGASLIARQSDWNLSVLLARSCFIALLGLAGCRS